MCYVHKHIYLALALVRACPSAQPHPNCGQCNTRTHALLFKHRSIPAVSNVAYVLFLLMYFWAIVGMNLWGNIKWAESGAGITRHANFKYWPVSMITEFRWGCVQVVASAGVADQGI